MKAQGSLEYLLIFAAVLAIAVVIVIVVNSMLNQPTGATIVEEDKYNAGFVGVELIGYSQPYDGTADTAPIQIRYDGKIYDPIVTDSIYRDAEQLFELTGQIGDEYSIFLSESQGSAYVCATSGCQVCTDNCTPPVVSCVTSCSSGFYLCGQDTIYSCIDSNSDGCVDTLQSNGSCYTHCCTSKTPTLSPTVDPEPIKKKLLSTKRF